MLALRGKACAEFRQLKTPFEKTQFLATTSLAVKQDISKVLKIPQSTVRRWLASGKAPGKKGPKSYLSADEDSELCALLRDRSKKMDYFTSEALRSAVGLKLSKDVNALTCRNCRLSKLSPSVTRLLRTMPRRQHGLGLGANVILISSFASRGNLNPKDSSLAMSTTFRLGSRRWRLSSTPPGRHITTLSRVVISSCP